MPLGSGLATPDVVDKDQDFLSGIWVSTALVPQMKTKTRRVKSLLLQYEILEKLSTSIYKSRFQLRNLLKTGLVPHHSTTRSPLGILLKMQDFLDVQSERGRE